MHPRTGKVLYEEMAKLRQRIREVGKYYYGCRGYKKSLLEEMKEDLRGLQADVDYLNGVRNEE